MVRKPDRKQPEVAGWRSIAQRYPVNILTDYFKRVVGGLADGNALFLAGGVAFSLLLAFVPFVLLLIVGLSFALGREPAQAAETVVAMAESFLPRDAVDVGVLLRTIIDDVLRTRGAVGITAALGFAWTSTRLFGSLRAVLSIVMDHAERGIVAGKLFDVVAAAASTVVVVAWVVLSSYMAMATEHGTRILSQLGVHVDTLSTLSYASGRMLGLLLVTVTFYLLYRGLPMRRPSREAALAGALSASLLFELARHLFTMLIKTVTPGSLYTGTIAIIISVVFWVYYAALLFLLGAEVAKAFSARKRIFAESRTTA